MQPFSPSKRVHIPHLRPQRQLARQHASTGGVSVAISEPPAVSPNSTCFLERCRPCVCQRGSIPGLASLRESPIHGPVRRAVLSDQTDECPFLGKSRHSTMSNRQPSLATLSRPIGRNTQGAITIYDAQCALYDCSPSLERKPSMAPLPFLSLQVESHCSQDISVQVNGRTCLPSAPRSSQPPALD
ncbi:hypothetical protein GQ53DRAFT_236101 [Thozetella sp. PMI_491]|nr:hypothetical protein GQ53DRAFT_236101 [Thozetella sp. PMI_491]